MADESNNNNKLTSGSAELLKLHRDGKSMSIYCNNLNITVRHDERFSFEGIKKEPRITCKEKFTFIRVPNNDNQYDGEKLADACSALLYEMVTMLPPELQESYRIELVPLSVGNDNWELRACLNPIVWFDWLSHQNDLKEDAFNIAYEWVDKCKAEKLMDYVPLDKLKKKKPICKGFPCDKKCGKVHKKEPCGKEIKYANWNIHEKCDFTPIEENIFKVGTDSSKEPPKKELSDNGWILMVRPFEYYREILLCPFKDGQGLPHGNGAMTIDSRFWKTAQQKAVDLYMILKEQKMEKSTGVEPPVTRIVFNFGHWETALQTSPYLEECHGHAHFWLTLEFIAHVKWNDLSKHHYPPQDYVLINAYELEEKRLRGLELRKLRDVIQESNQELKDSVQGLREEVQKSNQELKGIREDIKELSNTLLDIMKNSTKHS
ncbi:MAG: hypothetical protein QW303_01510 [Nitrososphaerota archaeon]